MSEKRIRRFKNKQIPKYNTNHVVPFLPSILVHYSNTLHRRLQETQERILLSLKEIPVSLMRCGSCAYGIPLHHNAFILPFCIILSGKQKSTLCI